MKVKTIKTADVKIGKRYRQELGEIENLAKSIEALGLLQPIGVSKDGFLIYGERRFRAVRDILGRREIPAVIVDLDEIDELAAELEENEQRKEFSVSERLDLVRAIQAKIEGISKEEAAKKAGFPSLRTMERVESVVNKGADETVEAMDAGDLSINQASEIAKLPQEDQPAAVERAVEANTAGSNGKKKEDKQEVPKDKVGYRLNRKMQDIFLDPAVERSGKKLATVVDAIDQTLALSNLQSRAKYYPYIDINRIESELKKAKTAITMAASLIKQNLPYAVCPECKSKGCDKCKQIGYVTEAIYDEVKEGK